MKHYITIHNFMLIVGACFLIDLMSILLKLSWHIVIVICMFSYFYTTCTNAEDQTYQENLLTIVVLCVVTRTVTYVDTDHMLGWGQGGAGQQPLTGRPPLCGKLGLSVLSSQLNLSSHPSLSCKQLPFLQLLNSAMPLSKAVEVRFHCV